MPSVPLPARVARPSPRRALRLLREGKSTGCFVYGISYLGETPLYTNQSVLEAVPVIASTKVDEDWAGVCFKPSEQILIRIVHGHF